MNFEIENLLITGNGFDLDLGLNTSYNNFVGSDEWKRMHEKRKEGNPHPSLIDFIEKEKEYDDRFDLESTMLKYVLRNEDGLFVKNVNEDRKDYKAICYSLVEYLCSLFWKNPIKVVNKMYPSYAGKFLCDFFNPLFSTGPNVMYTFNYTPIDIIYSSVGGLPTIDYYIPLHGGISKEAFFNKNYDETSIILGIMTEHDFSSEYSFLMKSSQPNYNKSGIEHDLLNARNVIIFGHSLNEIDFGYFANYFNYLTRNKEKERTLTFITKNESSKEELFVNIRKKGISTSEIEINTDFYVFLTDDYYKTKH